MNQATIPTTLQRAILLNNYGVSLLEANNTTQAIEAFQSGVLLVKQYTLQQQQQQLQQQSVVVVVPVSDNNDSVVDMDESSDISEKSRVDLSSSEEDDDKIERTRAIKNELSYHSGTKIDCIQDGYCYCYNRPILLPTLPLSSSFTTQDEYDSQLYLTSIILIFNMAMTYQCHASVNGNSKSLRHAIKVYQLAANMVDNAYMNDVRGMVIMCLIMNNLANIYSELCDYDHCRYCLKRVHEALTKHPNGQEIDIYATQFVPEDDWMELKLNYVYGQILIPSAASAA